MIKNFIIQLTFGLSVLIVTAFLPVHAQEFDKDLYLGISDIQVSQTVLKGDIVRIYVTVHNASAADLSGVVKFYDELASQFIAADQPVSILAGKTDDVFIDWGAEVQGNHPIAVRIVPWTSDGDDPSNNKVVKAVYVDIDSDGDGIGDRADSDDDNDGVADVNDAFPYNSNEWRDTDNDGIGDNADTDDDGDGKSDIEDAFPLDPDETNDTDGDGVGDNEDAFPFDASEAFDQDGDGLGDNADPDDQNKGPNPFIQLSETTVRRGDLITFNGIKSEDSDGFIVTYEWDFGDGMTSEGMIAEHAYDEAGQYIVTLKVTDDKGEYRIQQLQLEVARDFLFLALIIGLILLLFLLFGLLVPGSRFHHKKMKFNRKTVEPPSAKASRAAKTSWKRKK